MKRLKNYTCKTVTEPTKPGCWNYLNVEIFKDDVKVGEFKRNYHNMYSTFYPFSWKGKEYALYSPDYQTTSLMSLPDCKLIAEHASGFCPVEFAVPLDIDDEDSGDSYWQEKDLEEGDLIGNLALVAGCVWGDDSGGWKIEAIDLSKISEGKLEVKPLFGYVESRYSGSLDKAVNWSSEKGFQRITFPMSMEFQFDKVPEQSGFFGYGMEYLKHYTGSSWDHFQIIKTYDRDKKKSISKEDMDLVKMDFDSWYENQKWADADEKTKMREVYEAAISRVAQVAKAAPPIPEMKPNFLKKIFRRKE